MDNIKVAEALQNLSHEVLNLAERLERGSIGNVKLSEEEKRLIRCAYQPQVEELLTEVNVFWILNKEWRGILEHLVNVLEEVNE